MRTPPDPFWDELGVAWAAINPDIDVIMPRLQSRLRRQTIFITASLLLGIPLGLAALGLGVYSIWFGWTTGAWNFVLRGVAFVTIAGMLSLAVSALLRVRAGGATSLSEMLDFAIVRMEKTLFAIRLGFYACGVTAIFGLVGTVIRTHLSRPPAMSPFLDLTMLAFFSLVLFFVGRRIQRDLAKYRYLKRSLALDGEDT